MEEARIQYRHIFDDTQNTSASFVTSGDSLLASQKNNYNNFTISSNSESDKAAQKEVLSTIPIQKSASTSEFPSHTGQAEEEAN